MCAGCPTDPLPAGQGGLPPWPWDPPQITHPAFLPMTIPVGRLGGGCHCWVPIQVVSAKRSCWNQLLKFFFLHLSGKMKSTEHKLISALEKTGPETKGLVFPHLNESRLFTLIKV